MEAHPPSPALSASFLLEHLYFSFRITWSLATAADALIGDMSSQISLTSWFLSSRFCFTIALTTLLCSTDFTQLPVLFHQSPPLAKEQRKQAVWAMLFWLINKLVFFFFTVSSVFPSSPVSASAACFCLCVSAGPHLTLCPRPVMAALLSCGDRRDKICWFFHSSLFWWLCMLNNATDCRRNEVCFPKCPYCMDSLTSRKKGSSLTFHLARKHEKILSSPGLLLLSM